MGNELFKKVTDATGLPEKLITKELSNVLEVKGLDSNEVTLEELRVVMADYVREVILHAKNKFENGITVEEEEGLDDFGKEDFEKEPRP